MSIQSDDINSLILHYFQEMGYQHSSFSFAVESSIISKPISKQVIPPGSLVSLIQKGVLMSQIETGADSALHNQHSSFQWEVLKIRDSIQSSIQSIEERSSASRQTNIFNLSEPNDIQRIFLSKNSALILKSHNSAVTTLKFSPDSNFLAVGDQFGILCIWVFDSTNHIFDDPKTILFQHDPSLPTDITSLCWSENSQLLAIGFLSGMIIIYSNGETVFKNVENHTSVIAMEFQKLILLVGNFDGTVRLIEKNSVIRSFTTENNLSDVKWTSKFPVASSGKSIYCCSEIVKPICTSRNNIVQIAVDPRRDLVAASDCGGFVAIVDVNDMKCACEQIHRSSTTGIAWSTNSRLYFTSDIEGEIKIVDIQEATPSFVKGHTGPINCLIFDPHGKYFVSAGADRLINCWVSRTNRLEFCMESYEDITSIDWSSERNFLVLGMKDGTSALLNFNLMV